MANPHRQLLRTIRSGRDLLTRTFIHVPGIGRTTEAQLLKRGMRWGDLLQAPRRELSELRIPRHTPKVLEESYRALENRDARYFTRLLPRSEWWRLYRSFEDKALFLDIETTGLSHYYDDLTLVGLYDGTRVTTLLAGQDLHHLPKHLESFDLLITFNGALFDLPFLKNKFPSLNLPPVHIDLRYVLKRLGHVGGLKQIERRLGIRRAKDLEDCDGLMATVLWGRYLRGEVGALELLVKYNASDTTSLRPIARYAYDRLASRVLQTRSTSERLPARPAPRIFVSATKVDAAHLRLTVGDSETVFQLPAPPRPFVTLNSLTARIPNPAKTPRIIGIDLRALETRPTGWALIKGDMAETKIFYTDGDLFRETLACEPDIVSIDAPLTLPEGRCCVRDNCSCRSKGIVRECERILWRRGVKVYPSLLPSMQRLTERGIRLTTRLRDLGVTVIESYPGAAQDIMRIPRKGASLEDLRRGLGAFGVRGRFLNEHVTHDELDAITSAVVGYFYLSGDVEPLGNEKEGYLIIPRLASRSVL